MLPYKLPVVEVMRGRSGRGEAVLLNPGVVRPLGGQQWQFEVTRLVAENTSVDLVTIDPHAYDSTSSRSKFRPAALLVAVDSGRLQGTVGDDRFEVLPGQALLMDTSQVLRSRVDERVRLLRLVVDQRRLDPGRDPRRRVRNAVLTPSPVFSSCLTAVTGLLRRSEESSDTDDATAIATLLAGLQASLVHEAERQRADPGYSGPRPTRRGEIERFIAAHLADPDLSAASIARAIGCSLRTVHAAYDDSADTVGSSIRGHRVRAVEHALRSSGTAPSPTDLADEFGFRSTDQLLRAFRASTGTSLQVALQDIR